MTVNMSILRNTYLNTPEPLIQSRYSIRKLVFGSFKYLLFNNIWLLRLYCISTRTMYCTSSRAFNFINYFDSPRIVKKRLNFVFLKADYRGLFNVNKDMLFLSFNCHVNNRALIQQKNCVLAYSLKLCFALFTLVFTF